MNDKLFVFVLMPFSQEFDDIYKLGIKSACFELDIYCERVDEQIFTESILDRIYNQIRKADIVISDMTGRNPNVFYETGYAHAFSKKVILLTKTAEDIPFDLKHFSHIVYENSISSLKDNLIRKLQWFKNNPDENTLPSSENFHYYFQGVRLENGVNIKVNNRTSDIFKYNSDYERYDFKFQLDIYNPNNFVIDIKQRIGIITSSLFLKDSAERIKVIGVGGTKFLHIYDSNGHPFFPLMWDSFSFLFMAYNWNTKPFTEEFVLKIFSELEVQEITFFVTYEIFQDQTTW